MAQHSRVQGRDDIQGLAAPNRRQPDLLAAAAAFAGSPARGAAAMLAFGLGTLPNLLAIGVAAARLRGWAAHRAVRVAAGALVLGFGTYGLARAGGLTESLQREWFCL